MDQGTWQGIGTALALLAFCAICWWAFSPRNRSRFEEAAQLPFADDVQRDTKEPLSEKKQSKSDAASDSSDSVKHNASNSL